MHIDDIGIEKSLVSPGEWILRIESGGYKFVGYFDNLVSFMAAVSGAIKYFGQAHGLLEKNSRGEFTSAVKR